MSERKSVALAYLQSEGKVQRTLQDSLGNVFLPESGSWTYPRGEVTLAAGAGYDRWVDVPRAWLGVQPFWK